MNCSEHRSRVLDHLPLSTYHDKSHGERNTTGESPIRHTLMSLVLVGSMALPIQAHWSESWVAWVEAWTERATQGLEIGMLRDLERFVAAHRQAPRSTVVVRSSTERWRSLVASHFHPKDVDRALCLVGYESGGDPNAVNPSSGAAGLFQVMPFWWNHYGGDRFDPETNVRVAKAIYDQQGWWAWAPYKRGLCR